MPRINLFLKGNVDLHDTLHSCRIGGEMLWNGVNEVLRANYPGSLIRLQHETCSRTDAMLQAAGTPPAELLSRDLPLGIFSARSQFSTAIFQTRADAIILSLQPDITTSLLRHHSGFLFYPYGVERWRDEDRQWLKANFSRTDSLTPARTIENFIAIIDRIRIHSDAPILIFNMSPISPGEAIHCFQGMDETFATRVRRFNLALTEISERTGISVIDVDAIIAGAGADTHKLDAVHLTPAGYRRVAETVVAVLADLGLLGAEEPACAPA